MRNEIDINKCIINFYVNFLKSYFNFINIKEELQIKLLKFLYKKFLNRLFIENLTNFYNNENLRETIKNINKTDYKSFAKIIYESNNKNEIKLQTYGIMELLLLKEIGKANKKQINDFYDEIINYDNLDEIFTLEYFFIKFALTIIIYNLFYNKKFDLEKGKTIMEKFIKTFSKPKYDNVGIDFNSSKFHILLEPYIQDFGNSLNSNKSLSK
jgi:hypothetical protein